MSETTALIKALRELGLTQTEIARRTGIPQPRLSRWEAVGATHVADDALKLKALYDSLSKPKPADRRRRDLRLCPDARMAEGVPPQEERRHED